jgi:hypothetical protein
MNKLINNPEIISHLDNVYCDLRSSTIQGIGVFAIRDIPYGINPFSNPDIIDDPYYETIIDMNKIPENVLPLVHRFCYVDNNHAFIPRLGFNFISLLRYLNHSFEPNLVYNDQGDFITNRIINKDEELTFNYDIAYGESHGFK